MKKINNIEIIKIIFEEVHSFLKQKETTVSIESVLNALAHTVCHLEGKEEYDFFKACFEEEKQNIIESSHFSGPLIHNPIFGTLQFVFIKLEHLKIIKYQKIFNKNSASTKASNLFDFYQNEFSKLLKAPDPEALPPIVFKIKGKDKNRNINCAKKRMYADIPDYRWSPSDLLSPWLFIE